MRLWATGESIKACEKPPETRIFCEEGFWFRETFLQWSNVSDAKFIWPTPFPRSPIQALSIGLAIPFRFKEIPDSLTRIGYFSAYVSDGWGFMTAMLSKGGQLPKCPGGEMGHYCEFGRGRATFFLGGNPMTSNEKSGRFFAEAMHGLPAPEPFATTTSALHGKNRLLPKLKICLLSRHILDCVTDSP